MRSSGWARQAKIAVGGLNPHAGEGGLFGREEIEIIKPAIDAAIAEGIDASGPFGADIMFHMQGIDAFVVMLHDQGHIAAKLPAYRRRGADHRNPDPVLLGSRTAARTTSQAEAWPAPQP